MRLISRWMNCFGLMRRREMKKIKDERLLLKNLKNIRIAFLVQSIGLFSVLTYIALTEGPREATGNLFFTVFLLSMAVYQIGRASCRERVCVSEVDLSLIPLMELIQQS